VAKPLPPLTPSEQRFVDEYLIDQNATRAYRAAFPESTYHTARTEGSRLLAKPNIRREVKAGRDAVQKRSQVSADAVVREARRLAFADPLYLFEDDGETPRNIRSIPLETRRAIAAVKVRRERTERTTAGETTTRTTYDVIEYKLWPKTAGLDKLFAHLGLTQSITPLEALLAALPEELAAEVREALAGSLPGGGSR